MNANEILEILKCPQSGIFPCGSRITCNPPVIDTDEDWMILLNKSEMIDLNLNLETNGLTLGGSICLNEKTLESPQLFWSYTKDDLNLLITCCFDFFQKFQVATKTSKKLNLLDKPERIILFQAILYGNTALEI